MPCCKMLAEKLASRKFIYNQMEDQWVKRQCVPFCLGMRVCLSWAVCSSPFLLGTSVCSTTQSSASRRAASACQNRQERPQGGTVAQALACSSSIGSTCLICLHADAHDCTGSSTTPQPQGLSMPAHPKTLLVLLVPRPAASGQSAQKLQARCGRLAAGIRQHSQKLAGWRQFVPRAVYMWLLPSSKQLMRPQQQQLRAAYAAVCSCGTGQHSG